MGTDRPHTGRAGAPAVAGSPGARGMSAAELARRLRGAGARRPVRVHELVAPLHYHQARCSSSFDARVVLPVAVHDDHFLPGRGQNAGQRNSERGLAFLGHGRSDLHRLHRVIRIGQRQ